MGGCSGKSASPSEEEEKQQQMFGIVQTPQAFNNQFINKIMISLDRGKFIREHDDYSNLMNSCENVIIDDFYKMSFKQIFHFKNLDVKNLYKEWKSSVLK